MSTLGHVFSPVVVVVIVVVFVVVVLIVKFHAGCSWYNSTWQMPQRAIMGEQWIGSNYIRLHVLNICKTKCMPCFNEHPEQKFQASSLFGGKNMHAPSDRLSRFFLASASHTAHQACRVVPRIIIPRSCQNQYFPTYRNHKKKHKRWKPGNDVVKIFFSHPENTFLVKKSSKYCNPGTHLKTTP